MSTTALPAAGLGLAGKEKRVRQGLFITTDFLRTPSERIQLLNDATLFMPLMPHSPLRFAPQRTFEKTGERQRVNVE